MSVDNFPSVIWHCDKEKESAKETKRSEAGERQSGGSVQIIGGKQRRPAQADLCRTGLD